MYLGNVHLNLHNLNQCHPNIYQVPVNMTLFGNRVFADVINLRWSHIGIGWALVQWLEIWIQRQPWDNGGRESSLGSLVHTPWLRALALRSDNPVFESQVCHLLAKWPWKRNLSSLGLYFQNCKVGILLYLPHRLGVRITWEMHINHIAIFIIVTQWPRVISIYMIRKRFDDVRKYL